MRQTDDLDDLVRDGESVHVPLFLCDGRPLVFDAYDHQPHYARVTDAQARAVRRRSISDYEHQLVNAWKPLQQRAADKNFGGGDTCPRCHGGGEDPAYAGKCRACGGEGYLEQASNANSSQRREDLGRYPDPRLRTRERDAAEPDSGSRPEELRRKDSGRDEYVKNLSTAWQGRTDSRAATRIEQQGERWRHGR